MDAEERARLRELAKMPIAAVDLPPFGRIDWAELARRAPLSRVEPALALAALDALEAAEAEVARLRNALTAIEDTIEHVRFEQRSGHIIIVDIEESIPNIVRAALATTEPEAG